MTADTTLASTGSRHAALLALAPALDQAATTRHEQLNQLRAAGHDPVGDAQQAGLCHTMEEISRARARIEAGTFGDCTACRGPISLQRLEFRPWSATCVGCTSP